MSFTHSLNKYHYSDKKLFTFLLPDDVIQYCKAQNMQQFKLIDGDGNCFFRAVLAALGLDQEKHLILRQKAIQYIRDNSDKFPVGAFVITQNDLTEDVVGQEQYLQYMAEGGNYAEGAIITAVGLLLRCQINVCELTKNYNNEIQQNDPYPAVDPENSSGTITLLRVNNNHYHVAVPDNRDFSNQHPDLAYALRFINLINSFGLNKPRKMAPPIQINWDEDDSLDSDSSLDDLDQDPTQNNNGRD